MWWQLDLHKRRPAFLHLLILLFDVGVDLASLCRLCPALMLHEQRISADRLEGLIAMPVLVPYFRVREN